MGLTATKADLVPALLVLAVARLCRGSTSGLWLRAGGEDATADIGLNVPREPLVALIVSAGLMALSGALRAPSRPAGAQPAMAEDLTMRFGGMVATDPARMELRPGEILRSIGPNGSGKTTLLNQLSGVLDPTEGRIGRGGRDLLRAPQHRFAETGIACTFQSIRLFPRLTVRQNVPVAALSTKGADDAAARPQAALAQLGRETQAETGAGTQSYGDQRRVEISRALVCQPSLIFLDDPDCRARPATGRGPGLGLRARLPVLKQTVNAVARGGTYALLALGLAVVFFILGLTNVSFGELMTISGDVLMYWGPASVPFAIAVPVAILVAMGAATAMERIAFRPERNACRAPMLVASFAVAMIFQVLFQNFIPARSQPVALPDFLPVDWRKLREPIGLSLVGLVLVARPKGLIPAATLKAQKG